MNSDNQKLAAIGFDLGGSHFSAALVDIEGNFISDIFEKKINKDMDSEQIINAMSFVFDECFEEAKKASLKIIGIGGGSPGPLDTTTFTLSPSTPNLVSLRGVDLGKIFKDKYGFDVKVENDANIFTYGESWFGKGKSKDIILGVTLGTGFGTGVVIEGKIFRGPRNLAMEHAQSPLNEEVVIEDVVSTRGIIDLYKKYSGFEKKIPQEISELASSGDDMAIKAWKKFGDSLGHALSWIINSFDPDVVVIGGGLSNRSKDFLHYTSEIIKKNCPDSSCPVLISDLKDKAVIKGGAKLIFENNG